MAKNPIRGQHADMVILDDCQEKTMRCPKCNATGLNVTLMGQFYWWEPGPDENRATCKCGWEGTAYEAGAHLIRSEFEKSGMTKEEFTDWMEMFDRKTKENGGIPPIYEGGLAAAYINMKALKKLKLDYTMPE